MGDRPYRRMKVDELDQLFSSAPNDKAVARAILQELGHRSTTKALELKRRIETRWPELVSATGMLMPKEALPQENSRSVPSPERRKPNHEGTSASGPVEPVAATYDGNSNGADHVSEPPGNTGSPRQATSAKAVLTPAQTGVGQLLDYVRTLIELGDRAVWSLASYKNVVLQEEDLRNRIGIRHDLADEDGPIYIKIDRLKRIDPPAPPSEAKDWLTISKDPYKEPVVQSIRIAAMPASEAERLVARGAVAETDVTTSLKPKSGEELRDVVLRIDSFAEAKAAIDTYVNRTWSQWAEAERPRRETIAIYDRLFGVQQAIKLEGSDKPLEVVLGMGVARWKLPPNELDHPLIEQLVELELDESGAILVRPRGVDPIMALKPFTAMQNSGTDLVARFARAHFVKLASEGRDLSPFEKDTYTPILRYACAQLDRAGQYYPDHVMADDRKLPDSTSNLVLTDTWVLYARPRSENFFIADIERLRLAVEAATSLPGAIKALVTQPSDERIDVHSVAGIATSAQTESSPSWTTDIRSAPDGDGNVRFFFPKPFNADQIAIVERLESDDVDGVVVQGPPGTGKTHTIANIICHYLAKGRRVLVTSKSEGALAVLRDHIPEGIRDLAISLLTSEREGLKQLEATVNLLASKIASLQTRPLQRDIAENERRIVELEGRIAKIDAEIRRFAEQHLRRINAEKDNDGILPMELAEQIVRERERYAWFPDRLEPSNGDEPQFSDKEIAAVRMARKALRHDLAYLGATVPSVSDLPDAATLGAIHQDLASAALIERGRKADDPVMSSSEVDAVVRAERLLAAVEAIVDAHEVCEKAAWLSNLYNEWRLHGVDAESTRVLARLIESIRVLVSKRTTIVAYAVTLPDGAHTDSELISAIARAAAGQKPFGIMPFGKSAIRSAFASIRILEKEPKHPEEWKRVAKAVGWKSEVVTARAQWRALASEYSLPLVPDEPEDVARAFEAILSQVDRVGRCAQLHVPHISTELARLFPYGLNADEIASGHAHAVIAANAIRREVSRRRLNSARLKLSGALETLATSSGQISTQISAFLSGFVGNPEKTQHEIVDGWIELLAELERVRALRSDLDVVSRIATAVTNSGAPVWADHLRQTAVDAIDDPWTPVDWRNAWKWAQAEAHLRSIDGRERLRELDELRRKADDEMRHLFHEVVRMRTLLTLKARITPRVDSALQMFLTAIRRIGKGTGKSAARLRRDARDAMEASYAAVPCWIMPSWRVSESLPAALGSFDLVIFDEASQSDISALPAIMRASKVLIVGDDKQVSPTAAFIEEQKIRSLRVHYLDGQPFGPLMLPGNSLYELALACYPGRRIMLKEHFRCVEPIIRFSFQFYPEQIVPVRVPKASERLSPPLIDVYVPHGRKDHSNCNHAEARAIVDEVARIVSDPMLGKRSIGIISLIGSNQAQLIHSMLLERIGEDAYIRHEIACGDSAVFQGKERDIVFLSMVECPETCTSKTALPFQQRFNVALSRARDREYLFHSVTEEMLKPNDLKAKVLRHFRNPMEGRTPPAGDLMGLCQSGFERDVLARLLAFGYRVHPQVKVGPYSIDLVVEGRDDRRLAIELDGDQYHGPERWADDLARQRVLERVGWQFWRCWGSSFRIDPDACMNDLIRALNAMGVEPLGSDEAPIIWTDFRTESDEEDEEETSTPTPVAEAPVSDEVGLLATAFAAGLTPTVRVAKETVVQVNDRIQVQTVGDSRVRVVTLTANRHDPDLGFISTNHPSGAALLGAEEDSEIEFEIDGKSHYWMVVKIEKLVVSATA